MHIKVSYPSTGLLVRPQADGADAVSIDGASPSAEREKVGAHRVVTAEGGSLERRLTGEAASGRKAELQSAAAALAVTAKIVVGHPPARNARERRKLGKFRYGGAAATGTKLGIDVKTGRTRLTVGHSDAQIKPAPAVPNATSDARRKSSSTAVSAGGKAGTYSAAVVGLRLTPFAAA